MQAGNIWGQSRQRGFVIGHEGRPGPAQTDTERHRPSGRASFPRQTRTSTDRVAEPSFPGWQGGLSHRPGPGQTKR